MPAVTLTPVVTDDGWAGALAYAWVQVSGPDTATITDPAALATAITFPDVTGAYVFRLMVTRADDGLIGVGLWRVYVFADVVVPDEADGAVTVTVNGDPRTGQIGTVRIGETLQGADTCQFSIPGGRVDALDPDPAPIAVFNDVVLARHNDTTDVDVRLFGGVCLSLGKTVAYPHLFYHPSLVGYAWHLGRRRVTKTYEAQSISAIGADLLAMAPGGITGELIVADLPTVTIAFDDVTIADALTALTKLARGLDWKVDYFKRLHLAIAETVGDPVALSPTQRAFQDLAITTDGSQVVNRVHVHHTIVTTRPVPVDGDIEVDRLDGYSPAGGVTTINGNTIHYTGTRTRATTEYHNVFVDMSTTPVPGGTKADGETYVVSWRLTLMTPYGETGPIWGQGASGIVGGGNNAWKLRFLGFGGLDALGHPFSQAFLDTITGINVYTEHGAVGKLLGTINPRGGSFLDLLIDYDDLETLERAFLTDATAGEHVASLLTGCTGTLDTRTDAVVTVEDLDAQAALAVLLGGDDDGVIELSLQGGEIPEAEARQVAQAFLADAIAVRTNVSCQVRDDDAHPGQILTTFFPAPIDCIADLKIQQATISGFEGRIPTDRRVTAATEIVTLADILQQASGTITVGGRGGSSSGGGSTGGGSGAGTPGPTGATGATGATGPTGPPGADGAGADVAAIGYWSPLTNGDPDNPELIFADAETIAMWTATP